MAACRPCLQEPESGDPKHLIRVIVHNTECFAVCANRQQGLVEWIEAGEDD